MMLLVLVPFALIALGDIVLLVVVGLTDV